MPSDLIVSLRIVNWAEDEKRKTISNMQNTLLVLVLLFCLENWIKTLSAFPTIMKWTMSKLVRDKLYFCVFASFC